MSVGSKVLHSLLTADYQKWRIGVSVAIFRQNRRIGLAYPVKIGVSPIRHSEIDTP